MSVSGSISHVEVAAGEVSGAPADVLEPPAPARRPWLRALPVMGAMVAFVGLLAFGFTRDPRALPSPLVGRPAPPFTLQLLDGSTIHLEELRGKIVVLNFWATWCYPSCWNEAPRLEAAWRRYRERGVVVVGSVYQDTRAAAQDFVKQHGKTFPVGLDEGSRAAIAYGVYGVPETFFIDGAGRIAHKNVGEIGARVLEEEIQRLLTAPGPGRGPAAEGG